MIIDFSDLQETVIPEFYGGKKETRARMFVDKNNRIMKGVLEPGASIGTHTHETGSEIIFVTGGTGKAVTDEKEEILSAGMCHYCPKSHTHCLINDGIEDLEFLAVVPQQ